MSFIQIVTEYEVDDELLIDNYPDEWEDSGHDLKEFISYLLADNVITADDLGEHIYRVITPL